MLNRARNFLVTFLLTFACFCAAAVAADLGGGGTPPAADGAPQATRHYLENRTTLLMVRATFDVVDREDIEADIVAEARRIGTDGPSLEAMAALDRTLLAETSYFIVSLRYLTLVGGAVWPPDKPETTYDNDALILLDQLEADADEAIATGADPLPVLQRVQQLWLLSEGLTTAPQGRDVFAGRDEIVAAALAAMASRANS
jgi:hypothetical protein